MSWIEAETRPLDMSEMTNNAQIIANFFLPKGWTKFAISGMLGNMQSESTINPCRWQYDIIATPTTNTGFGLVQWTPPSKLVDWANGRNWKSGEVQCDRIEYEKENNLQWFPNPSTPELSNITFKEFTQLDNEVTAANYFIAFYEHPAQPHQPTRGENATYWLNTLIWNGSEPKKEVCYIAPIANVSLEPSSFMSEQLFGYSSSRPNNFHNGLDFGSIDHPGNDMIAVCDGMIKHIYDGTTNGLGYWYILNNNHYNFLYWESTNSRSDIIVNEGDIVAKGQTLSHRTTDHLHLSVTKSEEYPLEKYLSDVYVEGIWINPLDVLGHCFDYGDDPTPDPPEPNNGFDYLTLLLCDALNWGKF